MKRELSPVAAVTVALSVVENRDQLVDAINRRADGDTVRCSTEVLCQLGGQAAPRMGKVLTFEHFQG